MSTALKCPNSGCPYLFDPTGVPAGVVLTCPRCGLRFTLAPPPTTTNAAPTPPQPKSSQRPDPRFDGIAHQPANDEDKRSTRDKMLLDRGVSSRRMMAFWFVFTFAILLGVGVTVYFKALHNPEKPQPEVANKLKDCNLGYDALGEAWVRDHDMEAKMGSPIQVVYKRSEPTAYIAIGALPNDDREPRFSEMKEGMNKPLGKLFGLDTITTEEIKGGVTWLGLTAKPVFSFTASMPDGAKSSGECFAVSYKGIAYWCLCWAGELEFPRLATEFDMLRGRFKLLKEREDWHPKQATITSYGGHAAKYLMLDAEGIWTEDNHPEQQQPPSDLYLVGKIKRPGSDRFDRQPTAEVWVYVIDHPGGDPLAAGQKHVESLRVAELNSGIRKYDVSFDVLAGDPEGDAPTDPVEQSTTVVRLKSSVKETRDQSRLLVVSATPVGTKLVVVRAQCDFIDRSFFEAKLMQLAGSLRAN